MNKRIFTVLFFLSLMPFISCGTDEGNGASFIANSSSSLDFNHRCSKATVSEGYWNSYALFSARDDSRKQTAGILGRVMIGFVFAPENQKGIGVDLHKIRMEGFDAWAGKKFNIALQLASSQSNEKVAGDFIPEVFQVSSNGSLLWELFTEPENEKETERELNDFDPSFIRFPYSRLSSDSYKINLLLKAENSNDSLVLYGPSIESLKDKMSALKKPSFKELGFAETLNPAEEGGLFGFFKQGFKERGCIKIRKQAKKRLDQLF